MSNIKNKYQRMLKEGFFVGYDNERFKSVQSHIKVWCSIGEDPGSQDDEIFLTIPFSDFVEVAGRIEFLDLGSSPGPGKLNVWDDQRDMFVSVNALDFINELGYDLKEEILSTLIKEEVESAVYTNWLSNECMKNMHCSDELYSPIKRLLALEVWREYLNSQIKDITGPLLQKVA